MKKDKIVKNLKLYNLIMSNIWQLITTILLGVLIGYLLNRLVKKPSNYYMLFSIIIFFVIGVANFFIAIIKYHKQIAQKEAKERSMMITKVEDEQSDDEIDE